MRNRKLVYYTAHLRALILAVAAQLCNGIAAAAALRQRRSGSGSAASAAPEDVRRATHVGRQRKFGLCSRALMRLFECCGCGSSCGSSPSVGVQSLAPGTQKGLRSSKSRQAHVTKLESSCQLTCDLKSPRPHTAHLANTASSAEATLFMS